MIFRLIVLLVSLTALAVEESIPTHLKVKATFIRPDKDGKPEVYAEPSVVTVDGKQATFRVGTAEEGVVFTVTPKINSDGTLTLDAVTEYFESPPATIATIQASAIAPTPPTKPLSKEPLPYFHGVLTKDKLFSIEDSSGKRQWVPLGRKIDGWTLRTYDDKREALTLTRLGKSVELLLHKSVILETPATSVAFSKTNTKVTLKPGTKTQFGSAQGRTILIETEILDLTK